jgi:hypothetical protein
VIPNIFFAIILHANRWGSIVKQALRKTEVVRHATLIISRTQMTETNAKSCLLIVRNTMILNQNYVIPRVAKLVTILTMIKVAQNCLEHARVPIQMENVIYATMINISTIMMSAYHWVRVRMPKRMEPVMNANLAII